MAFNSSTFNADASSGRWTTYQLSFELQDATECQRFKGMMDALKDFNIPVKPSNARVNFDKSSLTPIWNYLDKRLDHNFGPFLGFPVRYQLEVCISHGYLNEHNITPAFVDKLAAISEKDAVTLLERVQEKKTRFFDPMEVFSIPRDKRADSSHSIPDTHVLMRRATVTPTGIFFQTPSVEISNRIIRQFHRYADRFIRISFTDEKSTGRIRFTDKHNSLELFSRVFRALKRGIVIGDRQYEFLAFGNSQLREHGAYFFAPTDDMTVGLPFPRLTVSNIAKAAKIREWMGVFREIRVVAKYSSRLGQCFSTTKAFRSCKVQPHPL